MPSPLAVAASAAGLLLALSACSSSSASAPKPSASATATPSPTPSPTDEPKPGGTLRIAGVARTLDLDPASPADEQSAVAGVNTVATADGNRLVGRLVLRQLYGYQPVDPTATTSSKASDVLLGPVPDLASGQPKVTDNGLTATITLRTARWDVPSSRRVTSTDELRALKRLCLPTIDSPVRGYLAESVVGYATACSKLNRTPPRTLTALDAVTISGLAIQGDDTLVVHLLAPTNDLTAILSLPETSPLPVESFSGLRVINDPARFVGDGPYRFVDAQSGESYALSRSPSWDPAQDPLRHAYVDHISIRGGLSAAQVTDRVRTGGADLSLDVPASESVASSADPDDLIDTASREEVVLAVGTRGPAALRLNVSGVRRVISACIDMATRTKVVTAIGTDLASPADALLVGLSLDPTGRRSASPSPSPSGSLGPSSSASVSSSESATPSSTTDASSSASPAPTPAPPAVRCGPTFGVKGATLSMVALNTPPTKAAASAIAARLAVAGVRVIPRYVDAAQYRSLSARGGWDLLLALRPLRYPAPRGLLAPLLDPSWPGADALAPSLSRTYSAQMLGAVAETETAATADAWNALTDRLAQAATLIPLAHVNGVYPRGPNVANAPTVPTFSNADPTNVALGSTRQGDPARSPTATP